MQLISFRPIWQWFILLSWSQLTWFFLSPISLFRPIKYPKANFSAFLSQYPPSNVSSLTSLKFLSLVYSIISIFFFSLIPSLLILPVPAYIFCFSIHIFISFFISVFSTFTIWSFDDVLFWCDLWVYVCVWMTFTIFFGIFIAKATDGSIIAVL